MKTTNEKVCHWNAICINANSPLKGSICEPIRTEQGKCIRRGSKMLVAFGNKN